jgi:hypothetical protein
MKLTTVTRINYTPIAAVLLGAVSWLGIYAVYANFAERGFALMQRPGVISGAEGALLVALYVTGLLLLLACALGAIVVLAKSGDRHVVRDHPSKMGRPL